MDLARKVKTITADSKEALDSKVESFINQPNVLNPQVRRANGAATIVYDTPSNLADDEQVVME